MRISINCLLLFFTALIFIQHSWAVDSTVLWLPKSYSDAKPLLLRAARRAEDSERCELVIGGEMLVKRNTADEYYFVITCRDALQRSYNMSYLVPRSGSVAELVLEQRSDKSAIKTADVAPDTISLSSEQALQQCAESLVEKSMLAGKTEVLAAQIEERDVVLPWLHHFYYPFRTKNRLDQWVSFEASCRVDGDGIAELSTAVLQRDQALQQCANSLAETSILAGQAEVLAAQIEERDVVPPWLYHFYYPFKVKNRLDQWVNFEAGCRVDGDGVAELAMPELHREQALQQCADSLAETDMLSGQVEVLAAQIEEQEALAPWLYQFYYPFRAKNRLDQWVSFEADCHVDDDGIAELSLAGLHREQALEACYLGLEDEAILIGWTDLLYDQVKERADKDGWAYRFKLPFNGKNRAGSLIRYNADCQVDEQAEAEVETRIDIEGIPGLCLAALERASSKMLNVSLFPQKIEAVVEMEYVFHTRIPFDALNPFGKTLHYYGECQVTDVGRSIIKIVPR